MCPDPSLRTTVSRFAAFSLSLTAIGLGFLANAPVSHSQNTISLNFESPQVHPLALTPDGSRLLAVNSPNGTLSVFQLATGAFLCLTAEICVGLEPVSVAGRNDNEA